MQTYLQAIALTLLGVVLILLIGKQSRDMGFLLSLGICILLCMAGAGYLRDLVDLLGEICRLGALDPGFLSILLKCTGIGFLGEVAALICSDAGQNAMGKAIGILSNAAILFLSIPLIKELLTLLEEVLGKV